MINLEVDEAYAFDYLSILHLKKDKNKEYLDNWVKCYGFIENQLGKKLMKNIIYSKEYKDLIVKNKKTFDGVEKSKLDQISSKKLFNINIARYKAKLELQKKFFKNSLKEIKI
jgi:hypothetical protein